MCTGEIAKMLVLLRHLPMLLSLALLSSLGTLLLCEAAEIFVRPQDLPTEECPGHPCHTLNEYVSNPNLRLLFAGSNTSISFLSGEHDLNQSLAVEKVDSLELAPYNDEENVRINSEVHALHEVPLLEYKEVFNVVIRNMTVDNVGISFKQSVNITLLGLTANNSQAVLMTLCNVYGTVAITGIKVENSRQGVNLTFSTHDHNNETQTSPHTQLLLEDIDMRGTANRGVGVNISGCPVGSIIVKYSVFADLEWGFAVYPECDNITFESDGITFYRNTHGLVFTSPQLAEHGSSHTHGLQEVYLRNISCYNNSVAILMNSVQNATIDNGDFKAQTVYDIILPYRSALIAFDTALSLKGVIAFVENIAYRGGAIALYGDSTIQLPSPQNTEVYFENNRAYDVGGALYFARSIIYSTYSVPLCAIAVESASTRPVFYFSNNTAENGGQAIYGAYLGNICVMPSGHVISNLSDIITNISLFDPSLVDDFSTISSDAQNVCFCDHNERSKKCKSRPPSLSVYPGQVFQISVAVYGDMKGFVRYPLSANVVPGQPGNELQSTQFTSTSQCSNFQYSILTNSSQTQLTFFVNTLDFLIVLSQNIIILDCPLGFELNSMLACNCHPMLLSLGEVACNITESTIQRQGNMWIGVLEEKNGSQTQMGNTEYHDRLLISKFCRETYCIQNKVKIYTSPTQLGEDAQCSNGHSGVLCGGCLVNRSLALGSNRCIAGCNNNYVALVIAFAVAGIALVSFIKILNLTVSAGTLNGLIFYANIVGAYSALEGNTIIGGLTPFLAVFVSWVNLDLGVETCFYSGMDAYSKAWLQFIFPAYLWSIGLFIIVLCHYSTRATRVFGNNAVPVLATVVLLSYSKMLRAIIAALSVATVQFLDGTRLSVWERDANVVYLSAKHVPLFLFSLSVLVLFWLPFTGILISIQWLQKYTQYRVLRWVARLMPFFDAFTGPLKPQHRYWVGVLLLARCTLYVAFFIYSSVITFEHATFSLTILLVLLASVGFKYRLTSLTLLELCYVINLGILAAGSIYISATNRSQSVIANLSVGFAFLQFTATVIYHAWLKIKGPRKKVLAQFGISMDRIQSKKRVTSDVESETRGNMDNEAMSNNPSSFETFDEVNNYREAVFEHISEEQRRNIGV